MAGSRNRSTTFADRSASGGTLRSAPGSNKTLKSTQNQVSRLHLMSSTGFSHEHEMSFCNRILRFIRLPKFSEYFMSVDHHQIWRRHLAWSIQDGDHLRNAVTSRFASNMVFMSLLLGTEVGVLFSPSKPADRFRAALKNESYGDLNFWAAIILCCSIGLTLSTLVANFTAWAIIGAVSPHNSHVILRSSVGLDAAQLPARLVILSIYFFVAWIMMFIFILAPPIWGYFLILMPVGFIFYLVIFYSSVGRLVIYSRAMQQREIFIDEEDNSMAPKRLFEELLKRAEKQKSKKAPLPLVYRSRKELCDRISQLRTREQDDFEDMGFGSSHATQYVNQILDSSGHYDIPAPMLDDLLRSADSDEEEDNMEQCNGAPPNPTDSQTPQNPSGSEDDLSPFPSSFPPSDPSLQERRSRSGLRRGMSESVLKAPSRSKRTVRVTQGEGESCRSILQNNAGQQITLTL
eukprot:CAMPEP_0172534688 /NCGR_PEP_ID=MMETSP1067-20121228/6958_1 /TAXON_ID=265564 ORGANISM="Thalassiosira punctigera, Strain Tpunct2005C2" /NCGR_SAMPLE_ID=MMETSP1067 /ASSEMBLY_ACC=CAM_ASM_000444 /LENGTH=460 /DNA_ID=CAMNT_0013319505 /DNA_START=317 /DNA_END=1699 /DNA_ORIENTATION=+